MLQVLGFFAKLISLRHQQLSKVHRDAYIINNKTKHFKRESHWETYLYLVKKIKKIKFTFFIYSVTGFCTKNSALSPA